MTEMARQRFDKVMEALRAMPRSMLLVIRWVEFFKRTLRRYLVQHCFYKLEEFYLMNRWYEFNYCSKFFCN
jgi:hypothetical protein